MLTPKMKHNGLLFTLFWVCILYDNSSGQNQPFIVTKVDKDTIRIGDIIHFNITITHPIDMEIGFPDIASNLKRFEIRDSKISETDENNGNYTRILSYDISTFEVGELRIDPFIFKYRSQPDTIWKIFATEDIPIIVESLLTGAETDTSDIRDIKPPVSLPMSLAIIIWICVITLFIIIAIVAYFYYQKKKGDDVFDRSKPPPLPAHEIAFTELNELKRSNLLANGEIKEYYDRLSDIIRKYIENRYSIYALEMTSEQLLDHIENFPHHIQNNVIYDLQNLLQTSDLAKFAKYKPADHIHGELYDLATDFVKKTRFVLISERESIENKQLAEEISK